MTKAGHVVGCARAGLRKTMLDAYQWRRYCVRSEQRAVEMSRNLNINDGLAGAGEPQMTVFGSLQLWLWF